MPHRTSLLKPTAVNSILSEARMLQAQGRILTSLMRGEPDFPTPAHIVEAGIAALRAGRTTYPDNRGERTLREAVAMKLRRDNALSYDPASEILITDGATMGLHAAMMTLLSDSGHILVPDPIYDAYQSAIRLTGAIAIPVAATRSGSRFTLVPDALERAVTPNTRALLLNTPWNPVGTVFTQSELHDIAQFAARHDLTIISDEIYEAITYDDHLHISPATQLRDRTILVNSFSKTYAMTGWRLGYCAASKHIVDSMLLVLQQSSRGPATFVQDAGVAAVTGPQDCVRRMRDTYAQRRAQVSAALEGTPNIDVLQPEGGFFTMLDIRRTGRDSDSVRRHLLLNHNLVVIHGGAYGPGGEGTLRVSFASGGDNLARGLALLKQGIESL